MWRFKPFMQKEPTGLEGRSIDVGNLKIHVRNVIAEGGFSCVYSARDAIHTSKQYAMKHMICNDEESLESAMKEISVMKSLKGHPNVVTLYAHTILDLGRTKEALLVMECCDKSLVNVLENRGAGYFEEKQVLAIFRDVCNAVFAMHSQSPPIAHRDLKAENLLLGSDGLWKLCDFGSTSTNHKRFEKLEEMGIEEDNIRKHTTPAYRAPEMWDLFRRELINEKVDIWALGCLLFRICYFKNAFDGESKLQILNGNYRIPESPKYSSSVTDLIRDMLQASPDDRPDITQASALLDWPFISMNLGMSKPMNRSPPMPQRSPPPPPSSVDPTRYISQPSTTPAVSGGGGVLGAFWSTQHAKDSIVAEDQSRSKFDEEPTIYSTSGHSRSRSDNHPVNPSTVEEENIQNHAIRRNVHCKSHKPEDGPSKDIKMNFFQKDTDTRIERPKTLKTESTATFQDEAFNSFVAEFDTNKLNSAISSNKSEKEEALQNEVERLKGQLKQTNLEKAEITSKFEKLSAICRSQRQEIQELKQALAARLPSPNKDAASNQTSPGNESFATPPREKIEGTIWELKSEWGTPSPESKSWQAFAEDPKPQQQNTAQSVRTRNGHLNKHTAQSTSGFDSWGFGAESFTAIPAANSQRSKPITEGNSSQSIGRSKTTENQPSAQPAGWAGF
ncbi:protein kinase domain-containing protein [Citrus sinensis]|uniref:Protein kinase domain-containing protein n=2 Tax=Citrus sinensis TaxID=2711 RepID=A0ACB8LMV3_CITSI|nr:protein kinase domain-containing protein [Citrus sinensis]